MQQGQLGTAKVYDERLEADPGARMVYSDLGAITLGLVVEAVTGQPLQRTLEERVFAPLDMDDTGFLPDRILLPRIAPTELDIYPTRSWDDDALVQPASRAAYQRIIKQGWMDALRTKFPEKRVYSFWDYKRNRWPRDAGLRLDHLLLGPQLAKRLTAAGIDRAERGREGASDHAPVWVELKS